eukprot:TRINITY_DN20104_c0_g1_i1.p1 TRINITY_DN20104_c0_g1~~TRINITY_DN20104_c0_g1_i1.p1  ORF type:complete len:424 (+),score=118.37 TRINITY_DN20104_c0_g1_i1:71-1342(+)
MLSLCQRNPYLRQLTTKVVDCRAVTPNAPSLSAADEKKKKKTEAKIDASVAASLPTFEVILDETILFAEGGGQPSDSGKIGGVSVVGLRRESDGRIVHVTNEPLHIGQEVLVEVDWDRRFDHMQQHTAQHLLSAIAEEVIQAPTMSWGLMTDRCTVDLEIAELTSEKIETLERLVNEKIRDQLQVRVQEIQPSDLPSLNLRGGTKGLENAQGPIRLVEIAGVDINPCCGTHLSNVGQIQAVKLLNVEKTKGLWRLGFLAGTRVIDAFSAMALREKSLNSILHCGPSDFFGNVSKMQNELRSVSKAKQNLMKEIAELTAANLSAKTDSFAVTHRSDADMDFLLTVARSVRSSNPEIVIFLSGAADKGDGIFVIAGPPEKVAKIGAQVAAVVGGKGGGKGEIYQGKAQKIELREAVHETVQKLLA